MTVSIGGTPRTFYSAYFVLDVTNPEVDPKLLWVCTDSGLGLTTAYPAIARVNPATDPMTDKTNEKWYVIFGSGPNGYQADLTGLPQLAQLYVVDLVAGPGVANANVTTMPVGTSNSFLGNIITVDKDLDYRVDAAYMGRTIHDGALPWRGKLHRLTAGCVAAPCSPTTWGIPNGGSRTPTEVIDTFFDAGVGATVEVGPFAAAPTATIDDSSKLWVFFGTGRYFGNSDKVDNNVQRLYGIKDSVLSGSCTEISVTSCHDNDLVDSTTAVVCLVCSGATNQVTDPTNPGVTTFTGTGTTSMIGLVASKDGWYVNLPVGSGTNAAERSVVNPTLIGGTVFFPTFVPTNDFCASTGSSNLYALFYQTGTAAMTPVVGTTTVGSNVNVTTKISLGIGMASSMSVQIGSQGAGGQGTGGGGAGCSGGMTGAIQQSTGAATKPCMSAGDYYSKYVSWVHQRD
jgi:type IV pilus assembly protein PilY1